ncbi:MAG: hypothetical protein WC119_01395 [Synergistaceae bacterium]
MEDKNPVNVTEFSGKEVPENPPKNTTEVNNLITEEMEQDLANQTENEPVTQLNWKDVKSLKRSRYFEKKDKYEKAFVLRNKKTGAIVEIQAVSTIDACKSIGWRPRHVKLLEVINVKERESKIKDHLEKYEKENVSSIDGSSSEGK